MPSTSLPSGISQTTISSASGGRASRKRHRGDVPVGDGIGLCVARAVRDGVWPGVHDEASTSGSSGGPVLGIPVGSLRCERCGLAEPLDRSVCDGPCGRWVGEECYILYGQDEVYCLDCRPPPPPPARPPPSGVDGRAAGPAVAGTRSRPGLVFGFGPAATGMPFTSVAADSPRGAIAVCVRGARASFPHLDVVDIDGGDGPVGGGGEDAASGRAASLVAVAAGVGLGPGSVGFGGLCPRQTQCGTNASGVRARANEYAVAGRVAAVREYAHQRSH